MKREDFEKHLAEVLARRRERFLAEVREAEAEHEAGDAHRFDDVEQLLDELSG